MKDFDEQPQLFGKTLLVDFLFGMIVVVTTLLRISNAQEQQEEEKKKILESSIETDGAYAVVATWPADVNDDVDLWVRDPSGNKIYYNEPKAELMYLEYDDRGELGDTAMTSTGEVKVAINRERAIIRGGMAGEYTVNVHMFEKRHPAPTTVKVTLYRLRGDDTEVLSKDVVLKVSKLDDVTAFRFVLTPDGEIASTNELQDRLTDGVSAGGQQQGGMSFPGGFTP